MSVNVALKVFLTNLNRWTAHRNRRVLAVPADPLGRQVQVRGWPAWRQRVGCSNRFGTKPFVWSKSGPLAGYLDRLLTLCLMLLMPPLCAFIGCHCISLYYPVNHLVHTPPVVVGQSHKWPMLACAHQYRPGIDGYNHSALHVNSNRSDHETNKWHLSGVSNTLLFI